MSNEPQLPKNLYEETPKTPLSLTAQGSQSSNGNWDSGINFLQTKKPSQAGITYDLSGGASVAGDQNDKKIQKLGANTQVDIGWKNDAGDQVKIGATADVSRSTVATSATKFKVGDVALPQQTTPSVTDKNFGVMAGFQNKQGIGIEAAANLGENSDGAQTKGYQVGASYQTPQKPGQPEKPSINFGASLAQNTTTDASGNVANTQTIQANAGITTDAYKLNGTFSNNQDGTTKTDTTTVGAKLEHKSDLASIPQDSVSQILGCDFTNTSSGGVTSKTLGVEAGGSLSHQLQSGGAIETSLMAKTSTTFPSNGPSIFNAAATAGVGYQTNNGSSIRAQYTQPLTGPKKVGKFGVTYQGSLSSLSGAMRKIW